MHNTKGGFTLIEVLVSLGIMVLFLPFAGNILTNSQLIAGISKHKTQAAFIAQQIIEGERQIGYTANGGNGSFSSTNFANIVSVPATPVIIDSKGDTNSNDTCLNSTKLFCGKATVTVTTPIDPMIDRVVVLITWNENVFNQQVPMSVTYSEDLVNDPMLN